MKVRHHLYLNIVLIIPPVFWNQFRIAKLYSNFVQKWLYHVIFRLIYQEDLSDHELFHTNSML
jgi:hypothetical protein